MNPLPASVFWPGRRITFATLRLLRRPGQKTEIAPNLQIPLKPNQHTHPKSVTHVLGRKCNPCAKTRTDARSGGGVR
jgi:hypothetical protein